MHLFYWFADKKSFNYYDDNLSEHLESKTFHRTSLWIRSGRSTENDCFPLNYSNLSIEERTKDSLNLQTLERLMNLEGVIPAASLECSRCSLTLFLYLIKNLWADNSINKFADCLLFNFVAAKPFSSINRQPFLKSSDDRSLISLVAKEFKFVN